MAAAAADRSKRLPKELQNYKREIKQQPFKDRVKAYFDCAPFISDLDSQKMDIILSTFSPKDKEEYYRVYYPIYSAIERYGDRIRAINGNRIIYANYIDSTLRKRDTFLYTADFLNLILPKVEKALEGTKEASTRETLTEALSTLQNYRRVSLNNIEIALDSKRKLYEVSTEKEDTFLLGAIDTLRGILSLLKCYLEALKEFLEWVGTPELLPREFKDMETDLLVRFRGDKPQNNRYQNPDANKFPLFLARNKVAEEYISIDYKALPRIVDIFGNNNLFANAYRQIFRY
jgi:hypothetical protein